MLRVLRSWRHRSSCHATRNCHAYNAVHHFFYGFRFYRVKSSLTATRPRPDLNGSGRQRAEQLGQHANAGKLEGAGLSNPFGL